MFHSVQSVHYMILPQLYVHCSSLLSYHTVTRILYRVSLVYVPGRDTHTRYTYNIFALTFPFSTPSGPITLSNMCLPTCESTADKGSSSKYTSDSW